GAKVGCRLRNNAHEMRSFSLMAKYQWLFRRCREHRADARCRGKSRKALLPQKNRRVCTDERLGAYLRWPLKFVPADRGATEPSRVRFVRPSAALRPAFGAIARLARAGRVGTRPFSKPLFQRRFHEMQGKRLEAAQVNVERGIFYFGCIPRFLKLFVRFSPDFHTV